MKTNEEIKAENIVTVIQTAVDGGFGTVVIGKWFGSVVWSNGAGWEHVSVSPFKKYITPSWDDMCRLKRLFFYPEETVIEYHPAEKDYVNNQTNCLHLWRPLREKLPTPPPVLVGIPKGMTRSEFEAECERVMNE